MQPAAVRQSNDLLDGGGAQGTASASKPGSKPPTTSRGAPRASTSPGALHESGVGFTLAAPRELDHVALRRAGAGEPSLAAARKSAATMPAAPGTERPSARLRRSAPLAKLMSVSPPRRSLEFVELLLLLGRPIGKINLRPPTNSTTRPHRRSRPSPGARQARATPPAPPRPSSAR